MQKRYNVVVSNTFTMEWEMDAYYELAKQYGYRVHSIIVENRHGNQSIHSVPSEAIQKMKNRFEVRL
jgi:MoaA/NifB/PqqE/SkfB family radical SAM enzyme